MYQQNSEFALDTETYTNHFGTENHNDEFASFACEMLMLDKEKVSAVDRHLYLDHQLDRIDRYHSSEVLDSVRNLYSHSSKFIEGRVQLSSEIFRFCELTKSTYGRVSEKLEQFFGSTFSKSYVCRLYKAGKLYQKYPELACVSDIDKTYLLSRLDEESLSSNLEIYNGDVLINGKPINASKRSELLEHLRSEFPEQYPVRRQAENIGVDSNQPREVDMSSFVQSLEFQQKVFESDQEISDLIISLLDLLKARDVLTTTQEGELL